MGDVTLKVKGCQRLIYLFTIRTSIRALGLPKRSNKMGSILLRTRRRSGGSHFLLAGTACPESFSPTVAAMIRGPNNGDWDNFLAL